MGIFAFLLLNKLGLGIRNHQKNFILPSLAGRNWKSSKFNEYSPSIRIIYVLNENILYSSIRQTFKPLFFTCFHKSIRQLLRILSTSWTFGFLIDFFFLDKHVAHWNLRAFSPWLEWLCLDIGSSLQSNILFIEGFQVL